MKRETKAEEFSSVEKSEVSGGRELRCSPKRKITENKIEYNTRFPKEIWRITPAKKEVMYENY